ncbi:Cell division control protein 7 [Dimargaris xerosporica]|nr:Cell division control protein 7 [Dimargaris xerosporica]
MDTQRSAAPVSGPNDRVVLDDGSPLGTSSEQDDSDSSDDATIGPEIRNEMVELQAAFPQVGQKYRLMGKIGEGTFSCVYKAIDLHYDQYDNSYWDTVPETAQRPVKLVRRERALGAGEAEHKYVALKKIYVTSSPARIANEIQILKDLSGHPNIGSLVTAERHHDQVLVVLSYYKHHDFRDYYRSMSLLEMRQYFRCLFAGLAHTHAHHIIHRDVKPSNFLFNYHTGHGVLVDFGLAQYCQTASPPRARDARSTTPPSTASGGCSTPLNHASSTHPAPLVTDKSVGPTSHELSYRQRLKESARKYCQPPKSHPRTQPATPLNHKTRSTGSSTTPGTATNGSAGVTAPTPSLVDYKGRPGVLRRDLRPSIKANRAGTRGFRAPEVLLKVVDQTPAIDIWSVGVIMLSILTHRFPFFNSADDQEALLEMGVLFGKSALTRVASLHDRSFFTNVPTVRENAIPFERLVKVYNEQGLANTSPDMFDFLRRCLALDPAERITASEALSHPFLCTDSGSESTAC